MPLTVIDSSHRCSEAGLKALPMLVQTPLKIPFLSVLNGLYSPPGSVRVIRVKSKATEKATSVSGQTSSMVAFRITFSFSSHSTRISGLLRWSFGCQVQSLWLSTPPPPPSLCLWAPSAQPWCGFGCSLVLKPALICQSPTKTEQKHWLSYNSCRCRMRSL